MPRMQEVEKLECEAGLERIMDWEGLMWNGLGRYLWWIKNQFFSGWDEYTCVCLFFGGWDATCFQVKYQHQGVSSNSR